MSYNNLTQHNLMAKTIKQEQVVPSSEYTVKIILILSKNDKNVLEVFVFY